MLRDKGFQVKEANKQGASNRRQRGTEAADEADNKPVFARES